MGLPSSESIESVASPAAQEVKAYSGFALLEESQILVAGDGRGSLFKRVEELGIGDETRMGLAA